MRILDIGVATGYALLCLSLISAMNPYSATLQSDESISDAHANEAIFAYVHSVGLVFLAGAPAAQVCSSLHAHSNSTLIMGGTIEGIACSVPPSMYEGDSNVSLTLAGRKEEIVAWEEEEA
jgi:hypothetical protein